MQFDTLSSEAGDDFSPRKIMQDLTSRDPATQMRAVRVARSILCEEEPPITAMVQAGIIAPLLDALDRDDCPNFQYRALGVLTNIAFGSREHTLDVANSGVIPKLITFLSHESDLTILILGNFAMHGAEARNAVLAHGAVPAMLPYMCTNTPIRQLRTFVRTYSNLSSVDDDDDKTELEFVSPALPYIHELLDIEHEESLDVDDKEVPFIACDIVVDICTALTNIMLGPDECIEAVQAVPGLTARLVALLGHEAGCVQGAALSAVGNMLAGTDQQVDRCLDANCLDHIVSLLQCSNTSLVKEAARATANILAGTFCQIQLALKKDVTTPLRNILADGDPECQKQAVYAVTLLCVNGSAEQCAQVMSRGVLEPYCALLASDLAVARKVLDGLYELMQAAERYGNVRLLCYMLDEFDVIEQIQQLQEHIADEDDRCKITNMSGTLRKHAREERIFICEEIAFTSEKIVRDLKSQDQETLTRATRAVYCMLREQNPPINALLEVGIMAPLLAGLDRNACADLRIVAAWALSNFTAGTRKHRMAVVHSGAIPKLLALLVEGDEVSELAACSLGDISLHGPETGDALLAYASSETALTELRTYVRRYIKLCSEVRPLSMVKLEPVLRALPFVSEILNIEDREINTEASLACVYLMGRIGVDSIEAVQAVPGLTDHFVALLEHEDPDLRKLALTAMGNMLAGNETQTDRCLDAGCLDPLITLLQCSEPFLVGEAARAVSNILTGTHSHMQRVLDKGLLTLLKSILVEGETECQEQAAYAITILCENGSAAQLEQVVSSGVLAPYCVLLTISDLTVADGVLSSLENLIEDAERKDTLKPLCMKLYSIGVLDQIQQFQKQEIDKDLRHKAVEIEATLRQQAREEHVVVEDVKLFTLTEIVQDLKTNTKDQNQNQDQDQDLAKHLRAARAAWSMLSWQDPPITDMVQAGVTAPLVAALDNNNCFDVQRVAICALLNISAGTHKNRLSILNAGAIPKLVVLLTKGGELAETAAKVLANLTSNALVTRDLVLSHEAVQAMLPLMRKDTPLDLLRSCLGAYKNFCLTFLSTSMFELASPALPYISELLDMEDQDVLESACEAICNLLKSDLDEPKQAVQAVPGLTERVVTLLRHEDTNVQRAALAAVGNMLTGTDAQVGRCLDAGCLEYIVPLLRCSDPIVLQLALRATSNILRSELHIQLALEKDILTPIMNILADAEPNSYVQYDAVGALTNITIRGTSEHRTAVVNCGSIPMLVALLAHEAAVAKSAASALGYITLHEPETRELVLSHGAVQAMLPHMLPDTPPELLMMCVMAYRNLCTEIVSTSMLDFVTPALPYISELLDIEDKDILEYACEALGNLVRNPDKHSKIEVVQVVPGLMARLVALLGHEATCVKESALTAVQNMLLGNEIQTDRCLDIGCLDHIVSFLECNEPSLVELATEASRNIFAGTHSQIQRALDKGILTSVMRILADAEHNSSLQNYAVYALVALTGRGTRKQKRAVIRGGAIPMLVALLPDEGKVGELAGVALYSIADLGPKARGLVLSQGGIRAFLPYSMTHKQNTPK